jgi:hypothetical protein
LKDAKLTHHKFFLFPRMSDDDKWTNLAAVLWRRWTKEWPAVARALRMKAPDAAAQSLAFAEQRAAELSKFPMPMALAMQESFGKWREELTVTGNGIKQKMLDFRARLSEPANKALPRKKAIFAEILVYIGTMKREHRQGFRDLLNPMYQLGSTFGHRMGVSAQFGCPV